MLRDVLFVPVLVAYSAVLVALFVFGLNFFYMTIVAMRAGDSRPRCLVPHVWPTVTVQLPLYNERYVAERLIDAIARMDYPAERLEIQVLDDSNDETRDIVDVAIERWRAAGVPIAAVRRPDRKGFKAGALAHGLRYARGEHVAIFDADFVPPATFLRDLVPALVADPGLAFVQARWGHVNRSSSLLTRLQALAIDGHFAIEQSARWAAGQWFNFNGTAGVWRRQALIDAGGWHDDTLTEDLDLSYRAFLAGWRAGFVNLVEAPAELPVSFSAYRRQQDRWATGSFECALKHLPAVWASAAPLSRKVAATLHLTGYTIHLLMLSLVVIYPLLLVVATGHPAVLATIALMSVCNLTTFAPAILFTLAQRRLHRHWLRQIPLVLLLSIFGCGLMVNTARAAWRARHPGRGTFERTPKFAVRDRRENWHRLKYQLDADRIVIAEVVVALVNVITCAFAIGHGVWAVAVYSGIFALGLASAAWVTVVQSARAALAQRGAR